MVWYQVESKLTDPQSIKIPKKTYYYITSDGGIGVCIGGGVCCRGAKVATIVTHILLFNEIITDDTCSTSICVSSL